MTSPNRSRPHEAPGDLHGYCPMTRDALDLSCNCPDLALTLSIKASSLTTVLRTWTCLCCTNPVDMSSYTKHRT